MKNFTRPKPRSRRTIKYHLEASDGVLEWYQFTLGAREHLGNLERLAQESLDLTSAGDRQLVVFRQLIHTKDSDDVLQGLVVLSSQISIDQQSTINISINITNRQDNITHILPPPVDAPLPVPLYLTASILALEK